MQLGTEAPSSRALKPRPLELGERGHQRLGHVLAAVGAEAVLDRPGLDAAGVDAGGRLPCAVLTPGWPIGAGSSDAVEPAGAPRGLGADGGEEVAQLLGILVPGRGLGAAGGVDGVGVGELDRSGDVPGVAGRR